MGWYGMVWDGWMDGMVIIGHRYSKSTFSTNKEGTQVFFFQLLCRSAEVAPIEKQLFGKDKDAQQQHSTIDCSFEEYSMD